MVDKFHFLFIAFGILLLSACSEPKLDGYWLETGNFQSPLIIKFDGKRAITQNLPDVFDTLNYSFSWNKLKFENKDTSFSFNYNFAEDTLSLVSENQQIKLAKAKSDAFYKDLAEQLGVEVDLPKGKGMLYDWYSCYGLLYINYDEKTKKPELWFNGQKLDSIEGLGILALKSIKEEIDFPRYKTVIFANKNVPYWVIKKIHNDLRKASFCTYLYVLTTEKASYLDFYGIQNRLFQGQYDDNEYLDSLRQTDDFMFPPPMPPPPIRTIGISPTGIEIKQTISKEGVYYNDTMLSFESLRKKVRHDIVERDKYFFTFKADNNIEYKDFIKFLDNIYQVYYDLRNEYAFKEYGNKYNQLEDSIIRNIRRKYPIMLFEADSIFEAYKGHGCCY